MPLPTPTHPPSDADGGTVLSGHQGAVWAVALAPVPAGRRGAAALLLSGSADKAARVWALPPDGVEAAAAGVPATVPRTGRNPRPPLAPARTLAGHHTDWVRAADLDSGGGGCGGGCGCGCECCCSCAHAGPALALTGGDDGRAVLWDVEAGAAVRVVRVAAGGGGGSSTRPPGVRAARFLRGVAGLHPSLFATGDAAGRVTLWDGRDGRESGLVGEGGHAGPVTVLVVAAGPPCPASSSSASSALLISAGGDGAVRAWDVRQGGAVVPPAAVTDAGLGPLAAAALTPCGRGVVVGGPRSGRVGLVEVGWKE
jgi:WD40 repeat protein